MRSDPRARAGRAGAAPLGVAEGLMADTPAPRAAGIWLALSLILGGLVGSRHGQPSLGVVIGFAVGVAICLGFWLYDKRR